ncbi:hypothetical protein ACVWWI_006633 [Bradyrhizobium sp. USDA 3686]|uniref:hypothetical protein n=1 Tax=Bradyrhizobium canariense TaxID=255045 RepID=UPI00195C7CD0|nr:hypothetical protein [Bradyrhizobium canariense]MBM7487814.1 hypothetical protein [Bradyrhizobium canariense]
MFFDLLEQECISLRAAWLRFPSRLMMPRATLSPPDLTAFSCGGELYFRHTATDLHLALN